MDNPRDESACIEAERYLHAKCHPQIAPVRVVVEDNILVVRCCLPECHREVARFRIAERTA